MLFFCQNLLVWFRFDFFGGIVEFGGGLVEILLKG